MTLGSVVIFLLRSVSVSQMWSFARIFIPIRNIVARILFIRKPLLCPECSSFWIGVATSLLYNPLRGEFNLIVATAFAGLLTHLVASYLFKIYSKL
jgi:hypothetical protein